MRFVVLISLVVSQITFASGWKCSEVNNSYPRVKLINHTTNTKTPAVMVVSRRGGTILSAKDEEISKRILSNGVRYTAGDESYEAILFVQYREGVDAPLKNGDTVYGKLVLITDQDNSNKETFDMECERYLKNN